MAATRASGTWAIVAYHTLAIALASAIATPAAGQASDNDTTHATPLPVNLVVPEIVRPLLTMMWQQSATFRRQCARLADNPNVIVNVELAPRTRHGRAFSRVERHDTGLLASVEIEWRKPELYVEHIAHELEHVLEMVDGIDLPRLASRGLDGAFSARGQYETARARTVGRTVALEAVLQ